MLRRAEASQRALLAAARFDARARLVRTTRCHWSYKDSRGTQGRSYRNRNCLGWATGIELAIDFSGRRLQFSIQESDDSRIAKRAVQGRPDCADCGAAGRKCGSESAARRTRAPARIEQFEQRQATVERWAEEAGAGDELARTCRQETGRAEGSQRRDPATGH